MKNDATLKKRLHCNKKNDKKPHSEKGEIGLTRREKIQRLTELRAERKMLLEARQKLLTGQAQSYSIGTRSLTRYSVTLPQLREDLEWVEEKIAELGAELAGAGRRLGYVFTPRG